MWSASAPHPQPASTTRSPGRSCNLRPPRARFARPAPPRDGPPPSRTQLQLAAHEIELRALRVLERRIRRLVIGAGVDYLLIEPAPIEIVAEAGGVGAVPARLARRVGPRRRREQPFTQRRPRRLAARQRFDNLV